ncbi:hypothetical protein PTKIN_Ptkin17bG0024700 [Pterospermum kingtungense]
MREPPFTSVFVRRHLRRLLGQWSLLTRTETATNPSKPPFKLPERLIAIGDLHGDLEKSKQAFRLAGVIDGSDRWCGGFTTVVQIGDVLDRGRDELKILYFSEKLKREAVKSGGQLITLNGNHEIMNVEGDFRGRNAVVWLRKFSDELAKNCDCSLLEHVLATIPGAKRMIMGHSIQEIGINGACDNRAIRIGVEMSKECINGLPEVLEIHRNSGTSNPLYQNKNKSYAGAEKKEGLGLLIRENGPRPVEVKA